MAYVPTAFVATLDRASRTLHVLCWVSFRPAAAAAAAGGESRPLLCRPSLLSHLLSCPGLCRRRRGRGRRRRCCCCCNFHRRIFWSTKRPLQRTLYVCDILDGTKLTKSQLTNADVVLGAGRKRRRPSGDAAAATATAAGTAAGKETAPSGENAPSPTGDVDVDGVDKGTWNGNGKGKARQTDVADAGAGAGAGTGDAMDVEVDGSTAAAAPPGEGADGGSGSKAEREGAGSANGGGDGCNGSTDPMEVDSEKPGDDRSAPRDSNGKADTPSGAGGPVDGAGEGRGRGWEAAVRDEEQERGEGGEEGGAYEGVVFRVSVMDDPERAMIDSDLERLYRRITAAVDE